MILTSFLGFLLVFILIGLASASQRKTTPHDYLVASGSVKPWLVGLSACASLVSGGAMIGITGLSYRIGISAAWIFTGSIIISPIFIGLVAKKNT